MTSTYKILVISLPDAKERQDSISTQLNELNLPFDILDAVDARVGEHPLLDRYSKREYMLHYGREASAGEIGCYGSHFLAWQYCAEHNHPVVVFEDDAFFHDTFAEGLELVLNHIDELGFIRLQKPDKSSRYYTVKETLAHCLVKYTKAPQSTLGYVIAPDVARELIANSAMFSVPVDVFIRRFNIHRQPIYGILPEIVYASIFPTGIGDRKRGVKKSIGTRAIILYRKLKGLLGIAFMNAKHYIFGPRL